MVDPPSSLFFKWWVGSAVNWNAVTVSPNAAGQHTAVPMARDMPYGRFLRRSPRHEISLGHRHGSGPFILLGTEAALWSGVIWPNYILLIERYISLISH
ncbi:hypothetical protein EVAR_61360_1 [Eumeta japonica]|uniref:Uncharacterized protein n=1 Tax=Eumeta variegata TaxID=151549 RepID=A0A4C1ZS90_EUMVA|nr:hypothetical protein EVAR_61360_1 [Eumeta japonica]